MLELKSATWKNFMSYGDYESHIELEDLGQCLITGEVLDENKTIIDNSQGVINIPKSNGAGKSTCPNVIQWVLFGRTMHSANPGDKVINYFTGKDCWAKVEFKNGDYIIRTRKVEGQNELIYVKDGNQTTLTSDTLSTTKNQQIQLNREFGLDWEVFCGSVFFNQYGKPWMEMADQTRKKAIERVLHIDRFTYYANVAKGKSSSIDIQIQKHRTTVESLQADNTRYTTQIERLQTASDNYDTNRKTRIDEIIQEAKELQQKREDMVLPNIEALQKSWGIISKINQKITEQHTQINQLNQERSKLRGTLESLQQRKKLWESKSGSICTSCEQPVLTEHVSSRIEPIEQQIAEISQKIADCNSKIDIINDSIKKINIVLSEKSPDTTVQEAQSTHKEYTKLETSIIGLTRLMEKVKSEENPHLESITELKQQIESNNNKIIKIEKDIEELNYLNQHYTYIYKAYNDRTKIKSYVFQEHIPFINSRLRHYLDIFGLDVKIELTPALGITSNMWGYEFESGGERKRTDVAFMLAMFDFHEQMYGRQCNVLVLDEVDGRLDDDGIDSLINIIKNDLAPKVETVLVISHRNMMFDVFTREIKVSRVNRLSQLSLN